MKLSIGDRFRLPSPSGDRTFRLAATITNYGWPSGAAVIGARDYRAAWDSSQVAALDVRAAPGTRLEEAERSIREHLSDVTPGLYVQRSDVRVRDVGRTVGQGLGRISQISDMLLVAAILAVVAAVLSSVWQRRARLSALRSLGMYRAELLRSLLLEIGVVLTLGCLIGMAFGLYSQAFLTRVVSHSLGFPTSFEPAWQAGLGALAVTVTLTLVAIALPLRFAVRTSPEAGFASE
jgi:putative ABC transport system permease protein